MTMLENPVQGVLLLAGLTFLATGFLGWISLERPDTSARVWFLAYIAIGISSTAAIQLTQVETTSVYLLSSLTLSIAFLAFGFSLRILRGAGETLRDDVFLAAGAVASFVLVQAYFAARGIFLGRALAFAIGNGIAASWAANQALKLTRSKPSRFASYLAVIFSIEAGVLFLRVPQLLLELEMPIRSIGSDSGILILIVGLALCSITKSIPYFALRYEELRQRIERDASLVREQSRQLAQKNAELASAMHAVPVACVVTRPNLQILYMNAESRRMLDEFSDETARLTLNNFLFGMDGLSPLSVATLRHALIKGPQSTGLRLAELTVNGLDRDDPASQWVFLLKPVPFTAPMMESVWRALRRRADRAMLLCDGEGRVLSAQPAWEDVIGHCAVFFGQEPTQSGSGLDLFASLRRFAADASKLDRLGEELKRGNGTSVLLRGKAGGQLTVALAPLRDSSEGNYWVIDMLWRPPAVLAARLNQSSLRSEAPPARASQRSEARATDIPPFLRK